MQSVQSRKVTTFAFGSIIPATNPDLAKIGWGLLMRDLTRNGEFQLASFSSLQLSSIDETQALISRLIRPHDMLSHGTARSPTELHYAPLLRMAVSSVRLGTEMKVAAQPVNDSFLIFTAIDNPFEMIIGR